MVTTLVTRAAAISDASAAIFEPMTATVMAGSREPSLDSSCAAAIVSHVARFSRPPRCSATTRII
jgi:hypothetical protein